MSNDNYEKRLQSHLLGMEKALLAQKEKGHRSFGQRKKEKELLKETRRLLTKYGIRRDH